jgi:hypothetical protein
MAAIVAESKRILPDTGCVKREKSASTYRKDAKSAKKSQGIFASFASLR